MDDSIKERIQKSFRKQGFMETLGASILSIEEGRVMIQCPFHAGLSQQNGFFHAGVLTSIVDSACGYAANTMMPDQSEVLSVEFKINFLKPADADILYAIGHVIQAGKTLVICEGMVTNEKQDKQFAKMIATMITIHK